MRATTTIMALSALLVATLAANAAEPQAGVPAPATQSAGNAGQLAKEFGDPPMLYRLRTYWFWTIPNVTPEGISKDIAAMHEAGMGGVLMMTHHPTCGVPKGWGSRPLISYNSPAYYGLVRDTLNDFATRGMQFDTHNVYGYQTQGGLGVRLDRGQRMIRIEHLQVTGPKKLSEPWPAFPSGVAQWGKDSAAWKSKWPPVIAMNIPPIPPGDRATFRPIAAFAVPGKITSPDTVQINADFLLDRGFTKGAALVGSQGEVAVDKIVRLDDRISAEGVLDWDVPPGDWTILCFFSEPTGRSGMSGLGVDMWDRALFMDSMDKQIGTIVEQNKKHIGKTFITITQDSFEGGIQTWSANMAEVFRERRGYDPLPWLPVLAGVAVGSKEQSERFIWDMRRTIADQFTFVGYWNFQKEWAHAHGLQMNIQGIPIPPINHTEMWSVPDKTMHEQWFGEPWESRLAQNKGLAAAVADYYGRPVVALETFTDCGGGHLHGAPGQPEASGRLLPVRRI